MTDVRPFNRTRAIDTGMGLPRNVTAQGVDKETFLAFDDIAERRKISRSALLRAMIAAAAKNPEKLDQLLGGAA